MKALLLLLGLSTLTLHGHFGIPQDHQKPSSTSQKALDARYSEWGPASIAIQQSNQQKTSRTNCCKRTALVLASLVAYGSFVGATLYCTLGGGDQCPMR